LQFPKRGFCSSCASCRPLRSHGCTFFFLRIFVPGALGLFYSSTAVEPRGISYPNLWLLANKQPPRKCGQSNTCTKGASTVEHV
jgi:hypothetical protein